MRAGHCDAVLGSTEDTGQSIKHGGYSRDEMRVTNASRGDLSAGKPFRLRQPVAFPIYLSVIPGYTDHEIELVLHTIPALTKQRRH
jgi:hypothetical protein